MPDQKFKTTCVHNQCIQPLTCRSPAAQNPDLHDERTHNFLSHTLHNPVSVENQALTILIPTDRLRTKDVDWPTAAKHLNWCFGSLCSSCDAMLSADR